VLALTIAGAVCPAAAQEHGTRPHPPPVALSVDSGPVDNPGSEPRTLWSDRVTVPGAAWLRLYFGGVTLGPGSFVRVSAADGAAQELNAQALEAWSRTSAYFNGDALLVELIAGADTLANRLAIDGVAYEEPAAPFTVCQPDTRVPSNDLSAGRIEPIGCSSMLWGPHGCLMSAGHCLDVAASAQVVEFNVPPNHPVTCANQHPPVEDQFPLLGHTFENAGSGNDWGIVRTGTNNLGQTVFERYGTYRRTALSIAAAGAAVAIWGYGSDDECATDGAQQQSEGQITFVAPLYVAYDADTTGGSSGSGVTHAGEIIAVHAHGGCPQNDGTRVDALDFAVARASVCIRDAGFVTFDRSAYACDAVPVVRVEDRGLGGGGSHVVTLTSDTEPASEGFALPAAYVAVFGGPATIGGPPAVAEDGVLSVVHGDTITATYQDADDGSGSPAVATATATIDCRPPVIGGVQVSEIGESGALVSWTTDEPSSTEVTVEAPGPASTFGDGALVTRHAVVVGGLAPCTGHLLSIASRDAAGNLAVDDNSGALHPLQTLCPAPPAVPDGTAGSPAMIAGLVSDTEIEVTWDNDCVSTGPTKLIHGPLAGVAEYEISGAVCGIDAEAASASWTFPAGESQWFLLLKENAAGVEGSWGQGVAGERNGNTASGQCGAAAKDVSGTCP
jgi:hypothetical protein